jgi:enamine deaminase RidA (YjgF/YER057c/UK114 family)
LSRQLISSDNPLERQVGYSRAVVQGDWCFVAGTTGRDPATGEVPTDVADQTRVALAIIERALGEAGFSFDDVVRATYYVTDPAYCEAVNPVVGEVFGGIRPAATMVVVAGLVAPELKVEIEVTALRAPSPRS